MTYVNSMASVTYKIKIIRCFRRKFVTLVPKKWLPGQERFRCVIVGGGVIGNSVAYHLAKLGWGKDVVLLEQNSLTSGTTWHAAGLIGVARATAQETQLCLEGTKLYESLEKETGHNPGYKRCGSLTLARSENRMTLLRRNQARFDSYGIEAELLSPEEACAKWGHLIDQKHLFGALWLPGDGSGSPTDLTMSFAAGARVHGVQYREGTRVTGFIKNGTRVGGVTTSNGDEYHADIVVNCAGQWARQLSSLANVATPLHSCEHFYVVTQPISGVTPQLPVMRDPDHQLYFREWSGGLLVGMFETKAKPVFTHNVPNDFAFQLFADDWEHFLPYLQSATTSVPALATVPIKTMVNGPESFTPDNQYLLGEAPFLRNFFVAAGFNSSGIASAGGAGKALVEWIVNGEPTMDLSAVDIRRFDTFHSNPVFLQSRVSETLGLHYTMPWPKRELTSARPLRRSPFYYQLKDLGACYGQKAGWERPNWFAQNAPLDSSPVYSWSSPNWLPAMWREHRAVREQVALFDQSSSGKVLIQGKHAERLLDRVAAGNMRVAVGKIVYTQMLNSRGGIECDVTITRINHDSYMMIVPTASLTHDLAWLQSNIHSDEHVAMSDVTSAWAVLSLMGPRSRDLLQTICYEDISSKAFGYGTCRDLFVGYAPVRALRISYLGELGYELHIPTEFAQHVLETIREASKTTNQEVTMGGYFAIDSLRQEKKYVVWGAEVGPSHTPLEAGLGFAVDWKKPYFVGRDALLRQRDQGIRRRLVAVKLDPELHQLQGPLPWGGEPILLNGRVVGSLSSAATSPTLNAAIGLGYISHPDIDVTGTAPTFINESCAVNIYGTHVPATLSLRPLYDPDNLRMK